MEEYILSGINEKIYYEKLDNGLSIYMLPQKLNSFNITYTIKAGSLITKFKKHNKDRWTTVPNGTAHFLEHKMFEEKDGDAFSKFSKYSASVNAYTTYGNTTYDVVGSNSFDKCLKDLVLFVNNPVFTTKSVNKEKNIIEEEIKLYELSPEAIMNFGLEYNLNINDNHKYLISGTKDDISKINEKHLYDFYDAFYQKENSFLVITGNFKPLEAISVLKEIFKDEKNTSSKITTYIPKEPLEIFKRREEKSTSSNLKAFKIGLKLSNKEVKSINPILLDLYLESILEIKFGDTSDFLNKLTINNLINDIIYSTYEVRDDYILVSFEFISEYETEIIKLLEEEINNLKINEKDLQIAKKRQKASYIRLFEDNISINEMIVNDILSNNKITLNKIELINKMNLKDINKVASIINLENISIYVIK